MPYHFQPSVVAARRLHRGQTVYLCEDDRWSPAISEAEVIEDEAHGDIRLLDAEMSASGLSDIRLARVVEASGNAVRLVDADMTAA
jgi:hypothetical protein